MIPGRQDLYLLDMNIRLQSLGRDAVPVRVKAFQHRPLPSKKIGHGHGVLPAVLLI
jgi:hypothetical protein